MTVNIMKQEFIFYKEALALKELGFDEPCFTFYPKDDKIGFNGKYHTIKEGYKNSTVNDIWIKKYNKDFKCVTAPTYSQAFRWFREKHGLFIAPNVISYENGPYLWFFVINSTILPFGTDLGETDDFNTYEEAELACLKKLIKIVKQK